MNCSECRSDGTIQCIACLRERLRETAQILIAAVGADGPMDAEEAARRAVAKMEIADRERQNAFDAHAKLSALVDFPYVGKWSELVPIIEERLRAIEEQEDSDDRAMLEQIRARGVTLRGQVAQLILAVKHCPGEEEEDADGMCACAHAIADALAAKEMRAEKAEREIEDVRSAVCADDTETTAEAALHLAQAAEARGRADAFCAHVEALRLAPGDVLVVRVPEIPIASNGMMKTKDVLARNDLKRQVADLLRTNGRSNASVIVPLDVAMEAVPRERLLAILGTADGEHVCAPEEVLIMEGKSKRVIEVQRGEEWERTTMSELLVGNRFRMWEDEAKSRYLGCFRVDQLPQQEPDAVWGVIVTEET